MYESNGPTALPFVIAAEAESTIGTTLLKEQWHTDQKTGTEARPTLGHPTSRRWKSAMPMHSTPDAINTA